MSFTVFGIGAGATGTGTLAPALPAGTLTGKLLLLFASSNSSSETITTPSGWTIVKAGTAAYYNLYGRIGTSSESVPSVAFSAGNAHAAFVVAIESSTGWPSIGSILVDSTAATSSALTTQTYAALTVTQEDLCGIQFAAKNYNAGNVNPVTAVTLTSGYTAAGIAIRNSTNSGLCISAQMKTTSPTVAGDIAQNAETTTGNSENLSQRRITVTLVGIASGAGGLKYPFDASLRVDSPFNALWIELLNPSVTTVGAFAAGDSYGTNGPPVPNTASVTPHDFGVAEIDFNGEASIVQPWIFNDASTGLDYTYTLTYFPVAAAVNNIRGGGTFEFTGGGRIAAKANLRGGGSFVFTGGGFIAQPPAAPISFDDSLDDAFIIPVLFALLEFDSGDVRLHTDLGTINTLGFDWLGVGTLGSVGAIEDRDDHSPTGTTLTLSGIDTAILESSLTEAYYGRPVTIYLGVRDPVTGVAVTPIEWFSGRMDDIRPSAGGPVSSITVIVESEMIDFDKSLMRYVSDSELQRIYPGALGFKYLAAMMNQRITIGSKSKISIGSQSSNSGSGER